MAEQEIEVTVKRTTVSYSTKKVKVNLSNTNLEEIDKSEYSAIEDIVDMDEITSNPDEHIENDIDEISDIVVIK